MCTTLFCLSSFHTDMRKSVWNISSCCSGHAHLPHSAAHLPHSAIIVARRAVLHVYMCVVCCSERHTLTPSSTNWILPHGSHYPVPALAIVFCCASLMCDCLVCCPTVPTLQEAQTRDKDAVRCDICGNSCSADSSIVVPLTCANPCILCSFGCRRLVARCVVGANHLERPERFTAVQWWIASVLSCCQESGAPKMSAIDPWLHGHLGRQVPSLSLSFRITVPNRCDHGAYCNVFSARRKVERLLI